jgi:homoaconitase/3-isopropylmalate dehydratase large subunit
MAETLLDKIWRTHTVRTLPSGQTQLFVGLHLVRLPDRTYATIDHIVPTASQLRPFGDVLAEEMTVHLVQNCKEFGIPLSHRDARSPWCARLPYWYQPGSGRSGDTVLGIGQAEAPADSGRG